MPSYDDLPRRRRGPSSGYAASNMSGSTARGDPRDDRGDPQNSDADYMTPEHQARYADSVRRENANLDLEYRRAMERRVNDSTGGSEGGPSRRSQTSREGFLGDDDLYPRQPRGGLPIGPPTGSLHRRSTRSEAAVVPYGPRGREPPVDDYQPLMRRSASAHRRRFDPRRPFPVGNHAEPAQGVIARQSRLRTFPDGSQETTTTDFYPSSQRPRSSRDGW